ncbi:MAG: cyclic nucleotide-binding domain-containing protein [Gemmatimonadetes bacterium]|nr:cyclic nucleotide-binding domain-containing protein [Gemmatimonadota bacterium]
MTLQDPEWGNMTLRDNKQENLQDILARLALFDTLTRQELHTIERIVHRRRFVPGEMIPTPRSGLFVVVSGTVHVVQRLSDGEQIILDTLKEGELVGEIVPLDDTQPATSILSAEQSVLVGFFRTDLVDLINTHPRMGFKILYRLAQIMSHRMQHAMPALRKIRTPLMNKGNTSQPPTPVQEVGI